MTRDLTGSRPTATERTDGLAASDVVRRAQRGDVDAFEQLYRSHAPAMMALSRRMLGAAGDPADVVQDIFVKAWEKLPSFRGESSLATWLHRLGVNVILDALRTTKRDALRFRSDASADLSALETAATSLDFATELDLESAVNRLPAGARAVLILHDIEGFSHDEIALMMGIAAGTARAHLWRARRLLARILHP